MRRVSVLAAVLLLLAGCGVRPSEVIPAGEAPRQKATIQTALFWLGEGRLVWHPRMTTTRLAPESAVEALLQGPTPAEQNFGLSTALPVGNILVTMEYRDGLMRVTVDTGVASWNGMALDQVACTTVFALGQSVPVVVVGSDEQREARTCPVR